MDLVVFVLIAECVAFALEDMDKPLFQTYFSNPYFVCHSVFKFVIQFKK